MPSWLKTLATKVAKGPWIVAVCKNRAHISTLCHSCPFLHSRAMAGYTNFGNYRHHQQDDHDSIHYDMSSHTHDSRIQPLPLTRHNDPNHQRHQLTTATNFAQSPGDPRWVTSPQDSMAHSQSSQRWGRGRDKPLPEGEEGSWKSDPLNHLRPEAWWEYCSARRKGGPRAGV